MVSAQELRVGISLTGGKQWSGGVSFIEAHVKTLSTLPRAERPRLFLVITEDYQNDFACYRPFVDIFDGIIYFPGNPYTPHDLTYPPLIPCASQDDLFTQIDFYFPVTLGVMPYRPAASWIPDFQHKYLPELFSPPEIAARDELCRRVAEQASLLYCTSQAVEKDFRRFYPAAQATTRILTLPAYPEDTWFNGDPARTQEKYGLPVRFALCANQFWLHKNHRRLFAAIALLRRRGIDIHLACTGLPHDYRSPGYFHTLLRDLEELGIVDLVHILGLLPRLDQIQLIRRSLFVIQPSLFEGLSLIVQECKALGKNIIVSDLDIFTEDACGIPFNRTDPQDLADKIANLSALTSPGPDLARETAAKTRAIGLAERYARDFCRLAREARTICKAY